MLYYTITREANRSPFFKGQNNPRDPWSLDASCRRIRMAQVRLELMSSPHIKSIK